jgi:hypothetical protein
VFRICVKERETLTSTLKTSSRPKSNVSLSIF